MPWFSLLLALAVGLAWGLAVAVAYRKRWGCRADLAALGLLALAAMGFFWQLLFRPGTHVPVGGGDMASFFYPAYAFAARSLQSGVFPWWNPHVFSGMPFAADMQSALFYPPNLAVFFLWRPFGYVALEALAVGHVLLGAVFAYLLARGLGQRPLGAWTAGVIFAFGGFFAAHLGHLGMVASAVWLPAVLACLHQALKRASWRWSVAAGAALALAVLAGHLQMVLYTGLLLVLFWGWWLAVEGRRGGVRWGQRAALVPAASLPLALALALVLAAVQLVPTVELVARSVRAEITYEKASEFAASPLALVTLLVPHFFGGDPARYWGISGSLTETYAYVGLATWLLAALALLYARRDAHLRFFFAGTAVLFLLLSLGDETVLFGWAYRFLPGFDKVRAPGRFVLLFGLSVALLAGWGLEELERPLSARRRPALRLLLFGALSLLAGGLFLAGPWLYHAVLTSQDKDPIIFDRVARAVSSFNLALLFLALGVALLMWKMYRSRAGAVPYLLAALVALDIFSANAAFNPTREDVTAAFHHPEVVTYLRQQDGAFRIDSETGIASVWQPDTALLHGLSEARGLYNPMMLADYERYWGALASRSAVGYDLLNVRYVVAGKDVELDWNKFEPALTSAPLVNLYRNRASLPRAFVVPRAQVMARGAMLQRLGGTDFDPARVLLLEEGPSVAGISPSAVFAGSLHVAAVSFPDPNRVTVELEGEGGGFLLLSEPWYPGWRAYADGKPVPVLRGDYLFQAVALPEGARQVRFEYLPRGWPWVPAGSLLGWLAAGLTSVPRRRDASSE